MTTRADAPVIAAPPGGVPERIGPRQFVDLVKAALPLMSAHDVSSLAAAVAFRVFLAIFPGLAAAVAIVSLVTDDVVGLLDRLDFIPTELTDLIGGELETLVSAGSGAGLALVLGVGGSLWAASSAAAALIKALNRIYGVTESRNVVVQRLIALLLVVALLTALVALVLLVVFGPQLRTLLLPADILGGISETMVGVAQAVAAIAILMLLFSFISWMGPDREEPKWHWLTPGSVVGVIGWLVLSSGFTFYVQTFGNYSATYGAIAGVVVVLVWLQLTMTVLLFAACLDVVRETWRGIEDVPPEPAQALPDLAAAVTLPAQRTVQEVTDGGPAPVVRTAPSSSPAAPSGADAAPVPLPTSDRVATQSADRSQPEADRVRLLAGVTGIAAVAAVGIGRMIWRRRR